MRRLKQDDMVTVIPRYITEVDVLEYQIVPGNYYPVVSADDEVVDILTDQGGGILQKKRYQVTLGERKEYIVCWVNEKEEQVFSRYTSYEYMMEYLDTVKELALSEEHIDIFESTGNISQEFLKFKE